jgi:hypothetical protein
MAGDGDLVVREDLVGVLTGSAAGVLWDVRGIAGAGKSVLLREVERRVSRSDVVVLVEAEDYFTAFEQGATAAGDAGDPSVGLRRFGRATSALLNGLLDRSARGTAVEVLNEIGQAVRAAEGLDAAEAERRAGELIGRTQEELNRLIAARTAAGKRVYLLADTFEAALGGLLGQWFLKLLARLDGAVAIVARRTDESGGPDLPDLPDERTAQVLQVSGLTADQAADYLVRRLGALGGEIAAQVHDFTGGHALAIGLTADLASDLRRRGVPVTAASLLGDLNVGLKTGQDDAQETGLGRLVTRFVESAEHDPAIGEGLDCLWVARRFDFALLEQLVAAAGLADGGHLATRLVSYSFVERRSPPGRPADQYYVVHDRVRDTCLAMLRQEPCGLERLQGLHRAAEEYYRKRTGNFLEGYEGWFRYQDPSWQVLVREWLYHVSQLDSDGQGYGRRGLAELFIDAFWWWGHNVPFAFCEELLADWAEMASTRRDEEDGQWGEKLREVYVRWPKGWRKEASPGDWTIIKEHLIFFLGRPEITEAEGSGRNTRRAEGLLQVLLGVAERNLNPQSEDVERYLQAAHDLFDRAEGEEWNVAWVSYQRADAALARGDVEGAVAFAAQAWRDLSEMDEDDFELAANLHRVHADAAWALGERGLALDLYARAALSAYKFQVSVGDPDIPPLDEYTQAFMAEMHERTAERLAVLHADGDDQAALAACTRIRQFFAPYWRAAGLPDPPDQADLAALLAAGQAGDVVGRLFPPPPAPADLHQTDTAYARTATKALYKMKKELDEPPGGPLPPAPTPPAPTPPAPTPPAPADPGIRPS